MGLCPPVDYAITEHTFLHLDFVQNIMTTMSGLYCYMPNFFVTLQKPKQ